MIIAVKFCGGCDPEYDRIEMFEKIKTAVGERVEWIFSANAAAKWLLVINGCGRACADTADFQNSKTISICNKNNHIQKLLELIFESTEGENP